MSEEQIATDATDQALVRATIEKVARSLEVDLANRKAVPEPSSLTGRAMELQRRLLLLQTAAIGLGRRAGDPLDQEIEPTNQALKGDVQNLIEKCTAIDRQIQKLVQKKALEKATLATQAFVESVGTGVHDDGLFLRVEKIAVEQCQYLLRSIPLPEPEREQKEQCLSQLEELEKRYITFRTEFYNVLEGRIGVQLH